jgi:hypothetical protein
MVEFESVHYMKSREALYMSTSLCANETSLSVNDSICQCLYMSTSLCVNVSIMLISLCVNLPMCQQLCVNVSICQQVVGGGQ